MHKRNPALAGFLLLGFFPTNRKEPRMTKNRKRKQKHLRSYRFYFEVTKAVLVIIILILTAFSKFKAL